MIALLTRPLIFIVVYVLSVIKVILGLIPYLLIFYFVCSAMRVPPMVIFHYVDALVLAAIFFVSLLLSLYLMYDLFFGWSVAGFRKLAREYSFYAHYSWIDPIFEHAKEMFDIQRVDLLIQETDVVNAFAVGSIGKKRIVLTTGLINRIQQKSKNDRERNLAIAGVIGHEMSHLVNGDFLPGLIYFISDRAIVRLDKTLRMIVGILVGFFGLIPILGFLIKKLTSIYLYLASFVVDLAYWFLDLIHHYLRVFISRFVEYRSDMDAAHVFGGEGVSFAMEFVGTGGDRFFSTHPSTANRIARVNGVTSEHEIIGSSFVNKVAGWIAIIINFAIVALIGYWTDPYHFILNMSDMTGVLFYHLYTLGEKLYRFFMQVFHLLRWFF